MPSSNLFPSSSLFGRLKLDPPRGGGGLRKAPIPPNDLHSQRDCERRVNQQNFSSPQFPPPPRLMLDLYPPGRAGFHFVRQPSVRRIYSKILLSSFSCCCCFSPLVHFSQPQPQRMAEAVAARADDLHRDRASNQDRWICPQYAFDVS